MSGHDDGSQLISITIGSVIPAIGGALIGAFAAYTTWPVADPNFIGWGTFFARVLAGFCVGGIVGFLVAWFMAWHASAVGSVWDRLETAPLWGAIPGVLFGLTLGPIFAAVAGLLFGYWYSAMMLGLFLGPIVGVTGWEIAYFVTSAQRSRHGHS
jgi:hypothetical protein